ncbi:MFS transporter [bacterium RCC_150]
MTKFQVAVIVVCFLINIVEGIDVFMMSFIMPSLSAEWGLTPVQIGYLLSAALTGMTIGAFVLSPLADRFGRRNLILGSLVLVTLGLFLSYFSTDVTQLIVLRTITGLGVGAAMASVSVLVSEYSSEKHSGLAMGLYTTGYPLGGLLAGATIGAIVKPLGWHYAFLLAAGATFVVLVLALFFLTESLDFLTAKQPRNALKRINVIVAKLGQLPLAELPAREQGRAPSFSAVIREVFGRRMIGITLLIWLAYGLLQAAFYFTTSWTPQAFTIVTGDKQLGITAGSLVSLGGILGSVIFAVLSVWVAKRVLTVAFLCAAAVIYVIFSNSLGAISLALLLAVCLGLINNAAIAGFYTLGPRIYSPVGRATGFGWMLGAGRIASIVSPIIVGYLINAQWSVGSIFAMFAAPLLLSACALLAVVGLQKRQEREPAIEAVPAGVGQRA